MRTLFLWKNDIIQIVRDPIMRLMCVAPLLLIVVFKFIVVWLVPLIVSETGLDLFQYADYILVFVLLMVAGMSVLLRAL
jgi:NADH:ubiquinone oxidoreductase subunit 3 (subunit A)